MVIRGSLQLAPPVGAGDATAAATALLSTLGGRRLTFAPGVYKITSLAISDLDDWVLDLTGVRFESTLDGSSNTPILTVSDCTNWKIIGGHFSADNVSARNVGHGIQTTDCTDFALDGVTVDTVRGVGINNCHAVNYRVTGCTVRNTLADGCQNYGASENGRIQGNLFDNTGDDSISLNSYLTTTGTQRLGTNTQISATGNVIIGAGSRGVVAHGGHDILVASNLIVAPFGSGCEVITSDTFSGFDSAASVTIAGNTVVAGAGGYDGTAYHGAIRVRNESATKTISGVSITGNTVRGSSAYGISVTGNNNSDVDVSGNDVYDAAAAGIHARALANLTVRTNTVRRAGTYGIYIEDNLTGTNNRLVGNTVSDNTTADYLVPGIADGGGNTPRVISSQTGSVTLTNRHGGKLMLISSVGSPTVTVAPGLTLDRLEVVQTNTGKVTFSPGSGVTLHAPGGTRTVGQGASVVLTRIAADVYALSGGLEVAA